MYLALLFLAVMTSFFVRANLDVQGQPILWLLLVVNAILLGFAPRGIQETFRDY